MSLFNIEDLNSYFPVEINDLYSFIKTLRNKRDTLEEMSKFLAKTMNIKLIFHEEHNFDLFLDNFYPICQRVIPWDKEGGEIVGIQINSSEDYHYQLISPTNITVMWEYDKDITEPLRTLFKNVKVNYMEDRYDELNTDPFLNKFLDKPINYKELFNL